MKIVYRMRRVRERQPKSQPTNVARLKRWHVKNGKHDRPITHWTAREIADELKKRKNVNHSAGKYARDEDGDGFREIHANSLEGFWSLLRSWLRPHRGISQEKLPWYLGFFEFVHNIRRRGKALLHSLLAILAAP